MKLRKNLNECDKIEWERKMEKIPLIILTGPTAIGKTELSIQLAKAVNGEIISADSMQIYRYMDIGTAKIKSDEMQGIKHYLIDEQEPDEEFDVVKFKKAAQKAIKEIRQKEKIPILVGGTGFYIQAVLYDICFEQVIKNVSYREELEQLAQEKGTLFLHKQLAAVDPESALAIPANNKKRVIRALEFYQQTGKKISEHNQIQREKKSPYEFAYFVLNEERKSLYEKIDKRVDQMIEKGLLEEVTMLYQKGYQKKLPSMQGLGYRQIIAYLEGEYSLEEAIDQIKKETRHFAKRQLTWFRREKEVIWIDKQEFQNDNIKIFYFLLKQLEEKGIIKDGTIINSPI